MEKLSLVYIDDKPEEALGRYLDQDYKNDYYDINYSDKIFVPSDGYESLLKDPKVITANIILIDSWLFENRTATGGKFTGEEFKLILKKFFPFIEVIVITQNGIDDYIDKVAKYDPACGKSAAEYYNEILPPKIDAAITNINQYRLLADIMENNDSWETVLKDKVLSTLNGTNSYDELTVKDIDNLIAAFKEIQVSLDE